MDASTGFASPLSTAPASRRGSLVAGALPRAGSALDYAAAAAVAGSSSSTGRRGVVATGAAPRDLYLDHDDEEEATRAIADLSAGLHAVEDIAMPAALAGFEFASPRYTAFSTRRGSLVEGIAVAAPFAGLASPRSTASTPRRGSLVVGALPRAFADARLGLASPGSSASSSRRGSRFVVGALPMRGHATNFFGEAVGGAGNALDCAIAVAVAGAGWSLSKGRCGVVTRGGALTDMSTSDDDKRAAERLVLMYDNMRSAKHIAAWVELARLKTTFEVSFDAGVLESGRDLRKLLEEIGELYPCARIYPWTTEACLGRLRAVIGREKLEMLMSATTPEDDEQFLWSAATAEALIKAIHDLMATLHSVIIRNEGSMTPCPRSLLYESCPVLFKRLLQCVEEFSVIVESTKFRRTQNSIRFRMLEDHALALEHVYAVALDIFQEVSSPNGPRGESLDFGKALRNRRITLFEEDMGITDYMFSIGKTDSKVVIQNSSAFSTPAGRSGTGFLGPNSSSWKVR